VADKRSDVCRSARDLRDGRRAPPVRARRASTSCTRFMHDCPPSFATRRRRPSEASREGARQGCRRALPVGDRAPRRSPGASRASSTPSGASSRSSVPPRLQAVRPSAEPRPSPIGRAVRWVRATCSARRRGEHSRRAEPRDDGRERREPAVALRRHLGSTRQAGDRHHPFKNLPGAPTATSTALARGRRHHRSSRSSSRHRAVRRPTSRSIRTPRSTRVRSAASSPSTRS